MTGRKQQLESKEERRTKPTADAENAKVQMQDFHITKIKSPRDAASGQAKS